MAPSTRKRKRGLPEPDALPISRLQLEPNTTFDLPTRSLQLASAAPDPGELRATPANAVQFEPSGLPQTAEERRCGGGVSVVSGRQRRVGLAHLSHLDESNATRANQDATAPSRQQGVAEIPRISDFGDCEMDLDVPPKMKKRQKTTGPPPCAPKTGAPMKGHDSGAAGGALFTSELALAPKSPDDKVRNTAAPTRKPVPAPTQEPKPKSRKKKRQPSSTPTAKTGAKPPTPPPQSGPGDDGEPGETEERIIVEPIRAALTWQEEEITVYDPDDEEDDGRGMDGVGFASTPAVEHGRVMKRTRQLENYRKALEGEERARRSQRRRMRGGEEAVAAGNGDGRKVRFADLELAADDGGQQIGMD